MSLIHRCQQGFTTVTLMGVLMTGGLLVAASFAAVDPDIGLTKKDEDSKQAYAAAEAGLAYYANRLGQDTNYYVKCTNVPPPEGPGTSPVNQEWNGTSPATDPRTFRAIPGYKAEYAIELLPAPGYTSCVENDQESMIDPDTGTFRIRSTGVSGDTKRSIIATMRRKGFIDFLYFTDYETSDPATYDDPDEQQFASKNCIAYRSSRPDFCDDISFISADHISGPLHTNDDILICGAPKFGRDENDAIELNGSSPGYATAPGCSSNAVFAGTTDYPAGTLPMPPSNAELANVAFPSYTFSGETKINLQGNTLQVTTSAGTQTLPYPPNGVIYVKNISCASGYLRRQTYEKQPQCGNVWVSGTYNGDLTIGADNDVIVTEDVQAGSTGVLLGLIANNFVRVYHPVNFTGTNSCTNVNDPPPDDNLVTPPNPAWGDLPPSPGNIKIEAAILAINHSFIVDNWYCGNPLGTLSVTGAIAQRFRGPVGTHSGTAISSGYLKNYEYNDRLRHREPPSFIDPVEAPWRIARQNEQVPAR
jgi:hypothetical protein